MRHTGLVRFIHFIVFALALVALSVLGAPAWAFVPTIYIYVALTPFADDGASF